MCNCKKTNKMSKNNHKKCGKSGFTLVELCIVLALVAITSVMIVSFSASMKEFTISNQEEYDFIEDCSAIRNEMYKWIAEMDIPGADFSSLPGNVYSVSDGTLNFGGRRIDNLNTINQIDFEVQGNLIKCNIYRVGSATPDKSYVFALRCTE